MQAYDNLTIVPFTELLASTRGGNDHRGGPVFPDWDAETQSRHLRRVAEPLDVEPAPPAQARPDAREVAYLGPLCHHFGHQVADFSMRILFTIRAFDGPLVFAAPEGHSGEAPTWFYGILEWFGVDRTRVHILTEPTTFRRVWIAPQMERIFGPPPSDEALDALDDNFLRRQAEAPVSLISSTKGIYLSRSKLNRGVIAGERALDEFMRRNGVRVLYPEDHAIMPLLLAYAETPTVILSEGSAAHTMQFLGRQLGKVIMILRDDYRFGSNFLPRRCQEFAHIKAIVDGISPNSGRFRENGLSVPDTGSLVSELSRLAGLDATLWSEDEYQTEARKSFERWTLEYLPTRRDMTPEAAAEIDEKAHRYDFRC